MDYRKVAKAPTHKGSQCYGSLTGIIEDLELMVLEYVGEVEHGFQEEYLTGKQTPWMILQDFYTYAKFILEQRYQKHQEREALRRKFHARMK